MKIIMWPVLFALLFCATLHDVPWLLCVSIVSFTASAFCLGAGYGITQERRRAKGVSHGGS